MADERVPAGWYPDPSGLPQLRWWDNHQWTEFVSDSQVEPEAEVEPEPVVEIPEVPVAQVTRPALEQPLAATPVDLGSAFDSIFGGATAAPEPEPQVPPLAQAFDDAFGAPHASQPAASAPYTTPAEQAPAFASAFEPAPFSTPQFDAAPFAATFPPTTDPLETMFVSSATSPVGVGTGETIGEALMRALQSA